MNTLNAAILALAPPFEARDNVPAIGASDHPSRIAFTGSRMVVWGGASDRTIYRDAHVNHAFRAWHDACHIARNAGFDLAGERAACHAQIEQFYRAYPSAPAWVARLIRAEVIGQAEHFALTGTFPQDQIAFTTAQLALSRQRN